MRSNRWYDFFAIGVMSLVTLVAVVFWTELPAEMAIHWSGASPDSYVSKPLAVFGLYAFGIGTVVFVRLAPPSLRNADPNTTILFIGGVFAWAQGLVLVWNLGYTFNIGLAVLPILLLAGLFVVYSRVGNPR